MTALKPATPRGGDPEAGDPKAGLLKGGARTALLDAARTALIAGEGDAEMAAIARGARLSTGLAYHHFGSKAGLLAAVVEDYYARCAAIANARYDAASWKGREQARTAAVLAFQLDDPFTATLMGPLGRTPAVTAAEAACTARLIERGAANIDNGQRSGELPAGLDPMLTGLLAWRVALVRLRRRGVGGGAGPTPAARRRLDLHRRRAGQGAAGADKYREARAMTTGETRLTVKSQEHLYGGPAGRFKQKRTDAPAPQEQALEVFDRHGYVVLKGLLDTQTLGALKQDLHACLGPAGRNSFEGFKTRRAYALPAKPARLGVLAAHPAIMGFLKARLHDQPLLSAFLAINIGPGEAGQIAHHDDGFCQAPRPGPMQGLSVIWAIDPFTAETVATRVWPGSHTWASGREPGSDDPSARALMEPGDAIVFHGGFWHAGGANSTKDRYRLAVTVQYCAPWLRTHENMSLSVSPGIVAQLQDALPSLLGY